MHETQQFVSILHNIFYCFYIYFSIVLYCYCIYYNIIIIDIIHIIIYLLLLYIFYIILLLQLAQTFNEFFIEKISTIQDNLAQMESTTSDLSFGLQSSLPRCAEELLCFRSVAETEVEKVISESAKPSCASDPMPSPLVVQFLPALLPFITMLVNVCFSSGQFPSELKSAIVQPLLKKIFS